MAQQQTFKNYSVYGDGKKHGMAQKATLDLDAGKESVIVDDGHVGTTRGKHVAKLSLTEYVPVATRAEQDAIYRAWKDGTPVPITCGPIFGKLLTLDMGVMKLKLDMDATKGTTMMDAELEGPVPDDIG